MAESLDMLKQKAVQSMRILTMAGSMGDTTGHVFVRVPGSNELIVRCRSDVDWGPGTVTEAAMRRVDFEGSPTEDLGKWVPPPERWIGIEILKARPDINCVIHAHPPAQILCSITNTEIRPIVGMANAGGSVLATGGVPVYPRSILVASPEIGRGMNAVMGNKNVCLLAGHGNVVVGRSVEEATIRAIQIENLAKLCWTVTSAGKSAPDISWQDMEEIVNPTQPAAVARRDAGGENWLWLYYLRALNEGTRLHAEQGIWQS